MEQTKYDVFISYSRHDYIDDHENVIPDNEVSKIMKALTDAGITYWIDKDGIYSGDKFTEELPKIIKSAPIFVYLSTVNANKSKYTSKEIAIADEYGKYIIPVRIDMTPYSDKVIFRIADVSFIKYAVNPAKGREDLIKSIKAFLTKKEKNELQEKEEERLRKEKLDRQREQQEEEKKRQEQIVKIESEIAALEVQKTKREKTVLQKEQELKLAQIDLKVCETKMQKLQNELQELKDPNMKAIEREEAKRIAEEKRRTEEKRKAEETRLAEERKRREEEKRIKEQNFTVGSVSFKMIRVEGGSFLMGATLEQSDDAYNDERPAHRVTLGDYYIGEAQVTQALWKAVMGDNPSNWKGYNLPVEQVSWNDCQIFIKLLNQKTGKTFRLPTEAEWEYAARGGRKSRGFKYTGSNNIDEVAWYDGNSGHKTHPVKQKNANELELYDMSGNVWEWCQDRIGDYSSAAQTNSSKPSSDSSRVLRGGGWNYDARHCRVTCRNCYSPDIRYNFTGFRLVLVYQ